jgi:hypothetical protein
MSLRVVLSKENMDYVMGLVRDGVGNPSDIIDMLLSDLTSAESKLNGEESRGQKGDKK